MPRRRPISDSDRPRARNRAISARRLTFGLRPLTMPPLRHTARSATLVSPLTARPSRPHSRFRARSRYAGCYPPHGSRRARGGASMRYLTLCCDYDGTLAHDGRVDCATLAGLERLLASGRRLVMVTGRELPDLQATFPRLDLFERVVAENGGLLYRPAVREEKPLAEPPPPKFLD